MERPRSGINLDPRVCLCFPVGHTIANLGAGEIGQGLNRDPKTEDEETSPTDGAGEISPN